MQRDVSVLRLVMQLEARGGRVKTWPCRRCLFVSYGALIIRAIREDSTFDQLAAEFIAAGWEDVPEYGGLTKRSSSCVSSHREEPRPRLRGGFEFL